MDIQSGTSIAVVIKWLFVYHVFAGAALYNAHGQYDQIFAKVGDGRLQQ